MKKLTPEEKKERNRLRCLEYYRRNREKRLEYMHNRKTENPEIIAKINKEYRQRNSEKISSKKKQRHAENPNINNKRCIESYYKNIEHRKLQANKYYHSTKERLRERRNFLAKGYRKKRIESHRIKQSNRRAKKRNLPNTFNIHHRKFMLHYWDNACAVCRRKPKEGLILSDDHWIPIKSDHCPGTVPKNMLPLCHGVTGCNNSKSNKNPHLWLLRNFGEAQTIEIEKSISLYFSSIS